MERRRKDAVIREIEPLPQVEFTSTSVAEPEADQSTSSLLPTLKLAWDHRQWLLRVAAWAVAISTVVAFLIPNRYESSVRIMPPDPMGSAGTALMGALGGKANPELLAMAGSLLGVKSSGALYVDLFRSRTVQERVVDRLNLQKVYWKRYKQDARKKLDNRTDVSEDRKSNVITLEVEDGSPQRARDIAQVYVEELNILMARVSTSSARRERIFIEQRLAQCKIDLEDAEKQFSAFASKNTTLDIKEQTKAMVASAAELQGQLIAAESELQSLEQIYTDNNVRVRSLRAKVNELKRQLQNIHGTDSSLASDATPSDELYPSIRKLPLLGVEWADLYRRAKIQETVFELLNQQYELARIQEAKEIPTINVVDAANVPEKKSWPPRLLIVIGLTILSVVGAILKLSWSEKIEAMKEDDPRRKLAMSAAESFNRLRDRMSNRNGHNGSTTPASNGDEVE